jgi:SAM-dependent methyltransferase
MHDITYEMGKKFFEFYCQGNNNKIVELGGFVVDGQEGMALRNHSVNFVGGGAFIGIDISAGRNVDLVCEIGKPLPLADNSADIVVSSSCFEHDVFFWESFLELVRITKDGGYIYISVPSDWAYHKYPYDCWRFYPDASVALKQYARKKGYEIELMESFIFMEKGDIAQRGWSTFYAVFHKGIIPVKRNGKLYEFYKDDVSNIHDIDFNDDLYVKDFKSCTTNIDKIVNQYDESLNRANREIKCKDKKIKQYKIRYQGLGVALIMLIVLVFFLLV